MITIGLTTWTEHPSLLGGTDKLTLTEYSGVLPVVEVDTPFYGIPKVTTVAKWQKEVPDKFQFILKANQVMTLHNVQDEGLSMDALKTAYREYRAMLKPLTQHNQLKAILFQFPPFFERSNKNFHYLQRMVDWLPGLPIAVEFRNQSWYEPGVKDSVFDFLKDLGVAHVVVDEPHALNDGVSFEPVVTSPQLALMRLHGRNQQGWSTKGPGWRGQRTLYRYSDAELTEFKATVEQLQQQAKEVCVIFNNNSGGDAADNALTLKDMLGISFGDLGPQQLDLF
ncbi:DUF72 domain-containing protein [Lactiplantibacillus xiangfangensis]|uniref:DUF72 domain-containing protein n=1 Tax=Lactiplantibacillus xiangfangensis TaxID=942150 RepID=A0A0R2MB60_9LACO|nr:DUF72 domain-containing protein [Lactiplantibacillus xiangfangensis]KRO11007.1 hypothetical protein IV64_GL002703 [Lactiplantibacillus xiangfangensis]